MLTTNSKLWFTFRLQDAITSYMPNAKCRFRGLFCPVNVEGRRVFLLAISLYHTLAGILLALLPIKF
jgi:hypothetical protein